MQFPNVAPQVRQYIRTEATGARDATGQNGWYYPIVFVNTFWQLKTHMTVLNSTITEVPLHFDLNNLANWKFSILAAVDEGAKQSARAAAHGTCATSFIRVNVTDHDRTNCTWRWRWHRIRNDQGSPFRHEHIPPQHNHRCQHSAHDL